jgi:hypothetical protein
MVLNIKKMYSENIDGDEDYAVVNQCIFLNVNEVVDFIKNMRWKMLY